MDVEQLNLLVIHNKKPGYIDLINELKLNYPLDEPRIEGEQKQKDFITLFGSILRMRNILSSFDEFEGNDLLEERDFQNYSGRYLDLRDEWRNRGPKNEVENINDDVVFEIELLKQIEINIDYILLLIKKYHDTHCNDKEILVSIQNAIDSSPELRSKKKLIETFVAGINDIDDIIAEWRSFVAEEKEKELRQIIEEENYTIINDTYNANKEAMMSALDTITTFDRRKVAILGDMLELGELEYKIFKKECEPF